MTTKSQPGGCLQFHFDGNHHKLPLLLSSEQSSSSSTSTTTATATDIASKKANKVMRQIITNSSKKSSARYSHVFCSDHHCDTFNDLSFYQDLKNQPGCIHVEVAQVHIDHCDWFLTGLQVTYRSTFAETESLVLSQAPQHDFRRFLRYRHYNKETKRSTFVLKEGEYITNVSVRRVDHIVDRMTIMTNLHRQVSFGGPRLGGGGGGGCDSLSLREEYLLPTYNYQNECECDSNSSSDNNATNTNTNNNSNYRRVVAFAGLVSEMSELVGCFSESVHWYSLKDLIRTRALLEQGRASTVAAVNISSDSDSNATSSSDSTMMLQDLLVNANDDIFCHVLSFLVPSTTLL